MICKPEEAHWYECCMMPKKCDGASCMAWKVYYAAGIQETSQDGFPPPPPKAVKTDKGYCGRT